MPSCVNQKFYNFLLKPLVTISFHALAYFQLGEFLLYPVLLRVTRPHK